MRTISVAALTAGAALALFAWGGRTESSPGVAEGLGSLLVVQAAPASTTIHKGTIKSPKNKTYSITTIPGDSDHDAVIPSAAATGAAGGDQYTGKDRKAAKLSIAAATLETFSDVKDLIASLPKDSAMIAHSPKIKTTATSNRVSEENRNVHVQGFLYAAKKENDNDFHLIIGRPPSATPARYMTMELSGLPPAGSSSFASLKAARTAFKTFFGTKVPGKGGYDFYKPPIPVVVEGSLFFDMTHSTGGKPGPSKLKANIPTIWEVHPISQMKLEP
jgi:hypothetical protein